MVWSKGNPGIGRGEGERGRGRAYHSEGWGESYRKDLIRWLWSLEWRKNGGEGLEVRMKKELSEVGTVWIEEEKERARGRASTEQGKDGKAKVESRRQFGDVSGTRNAPDACVKHRHACGWSLPRHSGLLRAITAGTRRPGPA
jgi:hypothetical protein